LPVIWGMDGRRAIMDIDELRGQFDEHPKKHVNKGWNQDNTLNALWDKKREPAKNAGKDPDDVKKPDRETVSVYHSALMSEVDLARRKAASKSIHRQAGETSKRSMMTNIVVSFFMDVNNPTPKKHRFDPNTASKGELKARELFAKESD